MEQCYIRFMDNNLVEIWLRKDPVRWLSGILAGILSGIVTTVAAMALANHFGLEHWFPVKLFATITLGSSALDMGMNTGPLLAGFLTIEAISVFFGFIFGHFTGTNSMKALLPMGLVWGAFSWIFIWNLFLQSFTTILAARISSGAVFPICMVFGLMMASVALFDKAFRSAR